MKVLLTQNIDGIAGSERYLLGLAKELKLKGYTVDFLVLKGSNLKVGVSNFILKASNVCDQIFESKSNLLSIFEIAKILNENHYDIVNTHLIHADLIFSIIKRFFYQDFKLISTKHGFFEDYLVKYGFSVTNKSWQKLFICAFAEKRIDHSIMVSKTLFDFYIKSGISKKEKATIIEHGLIFKNRISISQKKIKEPEDIKIAFVGRFVDIKDPILALSICKQFKDLELKFKCDFYGEGPLFSDMKSFIERNKIEDVVSIKGFIDQIENELSKYDFVLITSKAEGFGLVPLEAYACGTVVLALDQPAINTIVEDQKTGILFKKEEIKGLAKKVKELKLKKDLYAFYTSNAKIELENRFDFSFHVSNVDKLFTNIMK